MATPSANNFELFSSLRYDPILLESDVNSSSKFSFSGPSPFYMLVYHRDRMLEAARHFEWEPVAKKLADGKGLEDTLLKQVEAFQKDKDQIEPLRVRVLFTQSAELKLELFTVPKTALDALYPSSIPPPATSQPLKVSPLTGGALTVGPTSTLMHQWRLYLDKESTPSTAYTSLKTTHRSFYNRSRERSLPSDSTFNGSQEVLLYNTVNEMTEGSITSVYFWRGGRWVTPPVGNTPAAAIERGKSEDEASEPGGNNHDNAHEGDRLPSFSGRWGHSLRSSSKYPDSGGQRGTTRRWALGAGLCVEEPVEKKSVRVGDIVWVSNGVRGFAEGKVVG